MWLYYPYIVAQNKEIKVVLIYKDQFTLKLLSCYKFY